MLLTPNWREWYHFRHQQSCFQSGAAFEQYVTGVLSRFHDDFVNPSPAGSLGDRGCDGLADAGTILYACYGQRPMRNAERELQAKLESDFTRGVASWSSFHTWRFVTNAPVGPETLQTFVSLQQQHAQGSPRPLTMRIWGADDLWDEVVGQLRPETLNELFPGAPGAENIELADLLPLLDSLGGAVESDESTAPILPVPLSKMDFNDLPEAARLEFNAGRVMAPRIDRWYAELSDPELYDGHGEKFRGIYQEVQSITADPAEVDRKSVV